MKKGKTYQNLIKGKKNISESQKRKKQEKIRKNGKTGKNISECQKTGKSGKTGKKQEKQMTVLYHPNVEGLFPKLSTVMTSLPILEGFLI